MPRLYGAVTMPAKQPAADVVAFLAACRHALRDVLDELRAIVAHAVPRREWEFTGNAPSFRVANGEHCVTFNLSAKDRVRIVFHRGAKAKDASGKGPLVDLDHAWLAWPAADRAVATVPSPDEVGVAKAKLRQLVVAWVAAVG